MFTDGLQNVQIQKKNVYICMFWLVPKNYTKNSWKDTQNLPEHISEQSSKVPLKIFSHVVGALPARKDYDTWIFSFGRELTFLNEKDSKKIKFLTIFLEYFNVVHIFNFFICFFRYGRTPKKGKIFYFPLFLSDFEKKKNQEKF